MIALLVPGQGSQTPGMLTPWLELPGAAADLARWSEVAGLDLVHLGTGADAAEIRDTAVAQPLLTAAALLSSRGLQPDVVCGHSIGEIGALAVAGVLSPIDAMRLAAERGRAMAAAAASLPTGLAAVLGGDGAQVLEAALLHGLQVATVNVEGQLVLGGPTDALEALAADPPSGARVRRLETAGAFHTAAMAPAVAALTAVLDELTPGEPTCRVVANADGAVVTDGRTLLDRLVGQLTGPVRFDLCLRTIAALQPSLVLELAPGGTLTAIAKRALPGVPCTAIRTPADLLATA